MNLANQRRDRMPRGGSLRVSIDSRHLDGQGTTAPGQGRLCLPDRGRHGLRQSLAAILPRSSSLLQTKEEGRGGPRAGTAQDIAKQHDGWIEVETAVGAGSAFRVFLPESADVARSPGRRQGARGQEGKSTILPRGGRDRRARNSPPPCWQQERPHGAPGGLGRQGPRGKIATIRTNHE